MIKRYSSTPAWIAHLMREKVRVESSRREIKRLGSEVCGTICGIVASTPLSEVYNYNLESASVGDDGLGGSDD